MGLSTPFVIESMPRLTVEENGGLCPECLYKSELTSISRPTGVTTSFPSMYALLACMNLEAKYEQFPYSIKLETYSSNSTGRELSSSEASK